MIHVYLRLLLISKTKKNSFLTLWEGFHFGLSLPKTIITLLFAHYNCLVLNLAPSVIVHFDILWPILHSLPIRALQKPFAAKCSLTDRRTEIRTTIKIKSIRLACCN